MLYETSSLTQQIGRTDSEVSIKTSNSRIVSSVDQYLRLVRPLRFEVQAILAAIVDVMGKMWKARETYEPGPGEKLLCDARNRAQGPVHCLGRDTNDTHRVVLNP